MTSQVVNQINCAIILVNIGYTIASVTFLMLSVVLIKSFRDH